MRRLALLGCGVLGGMLGVICLSGRATPLDQALDVLTGGGDWLDRYTILSLRLPRATLAAVAGAGLALSGLLLQGVTRNPLAAPGLLGVSSGAGLAVTLLVASYGADAPPAAWLLPVAAFAGSVVAISATLFWSDALRGGAPARLLVVGIAVGAAAGALSQVIALGMNPGLLRSVATWQAGTLGGRGLGSAAVAAPVVLCTAGLSLALAGRLDVLALGDDAAVGLGVRPARVRVQAVIIAALAAAACVAVAGGIGFVGLFAPHIACALVGRRHLLRVPAALAVGAITTCLADILAHTLVRPTVLPTGAIAAVVGVPWLLVLLARMHRL